MFDIKLVADGNIKYKQWKGTWIDNFALWVSCELNSDGIGVVILLPIFFGSSIEALGTVRSSRLTNDNHFGTSLLVLGQS